MEGIRLLDSGREAPISRHPFIAKQQQQERDTKAHKPYRGLVNVARATDTQFLQNPTGQRSLDKTKILLASGSKGPEGSAGCMNWNVKSMKAGGFRSFISLFTAMSSIPRIV